MGELTSLALCLSSPTAYERASDEPRSITPESRLGRCPRALPVLSGDTSMGVVLSPPGLVTLIILQGVEFVGVWGRRSWGWRGVDPRKRPLFEPSPSGRGRGPPRSGGRVRG